MKRLVLAVLLVVPLNAYAAGDLVGFTKKEISAVPVPETFVPARVAFTEEKKGTEKNGYWCRDYKTERACESEGWPHCKWDSFRDECVSKDKGIETVAEKGGICTIHYSCAGIGQSACTSYKGCSWSWSGPKGKCVGSYCAN